MITEEGYEIPPMSKEEADASVEDMSGFVDFMEGICEHCGNKRINCTKKCTQESMRRHGFSEYAIAQVKGLNGGIDNGSTKKK